MNDEELLANLYNAFDPFEPADSLKYVDCGSARGDANIGRIAGMILRIWL